MAVKGSCHCGAVKIAVPGAPEWVARCNCSICRRSGALMAYYRPEEVEVQGETATYITGDRFIRFHFCRTCHCHTHWSPNPEALAGDLPQEVRDVLAVRRGVNARLLDGYSERDGESLFDGQSLEVRPMNNAD